MEDIGTYDGIWYYKEAFWYFNACWYILRPFGLFYGHFPKKNLATLISRRLQSQWRTTEPRPLIPDGTFAYQKNLKNIVVGIHIWIALGQKWCFWVFCYF
jgi:hypothetical protein